MKTVKLIPLFEWNCPECASVEYVKPEFNELTEEEREELIQQFDTEQDIPPDFAYDVFSVPDQVVCGKCWEKFEIDTSSI